MRYAIRVNRFSRSFWQEGGRSCLHLNKSLKASPATPTNGSGWPSPGTSIFGVIALGLLLGVRPSLRVAGVLLALPLLSVSLLAWMAANPFNGTLFALTAVDSLSWPCGCPTNASRLPPPGLSPPASSCLHSAGSIPTFLDSASFVTYLYAAPTGLVPCPTLSIVIGLSPIVAGLDARAWSLLLGAVMGILYGLFGALRLGVTIDYILLLGALLLVATAFLPHGEGRQPRLAHSGLHQGRIVFSVSSPMFAPQSTTATRCRGSQPDGEQPGNGHAGGALHQQVMALHDQAHGRGDLGFIDQHVLIHHPAGEQVEGNRPRLDAAGGAVGESRQRGRSRICPACSNRQP